ncbi:MAG TPA: metal-dependent hydrolase [Pirellulales bacterium]|jgi:membrane-bound metal-dependent hydrolase YbcI (DUF457 family)|nr:metal-dependent hydrolase [Pirellulales bacterium]
MAGFKTHITTSTVLGIGGGVTAFSLYHIPAPTSILAAGLCGVSGMLPDLDSGPGRPLRESMAFAAAVVPMMMVDRFRAMGMGLESIILVGGAMYLVIRFGMAALLRHFTVHRGMFHSFPACAIAGETAFLLFGCERTDLRYFVAGAVMVGFMSHLILDEIWSIDFRRGVPHLKSSFGTAMKFWGPAMGPNVLTYLLFAGITFFAVNDPVWMSRLGSWADGQHDLAARVLNKLGLEKLQLPDSDSNSGAPPMINISNPPPANMNGMAPIGGSRR